MAIFETAQFAIRRQSKSVSPFAFFLSCATFKKAFSLNKTRCLEVLKCDRSIKQKYLSIPSHRSKSALIIFSLISFSPSFFLVILRNPLLGFGCRHACFRDCERVREGKSAKRFNSGQCTRLLRRSRHFSLLPTF